MKRRSDKRVVAMGLAGVALAWLASSRPASAMDRYKWSYRPVVVFAGGAGDAQLARQRQIIAALRPAFIDRKVVVVSVAGDVVTADLGPKPGQSGSALRQRYGVPPGEFRVLLIGKDGGVKLSSGEPIAAQTLFRTIDSMPMRRDETRRK